jgi:peptidyl-tRNA hydrolase, PTH1 family
MLIVGLGNPGAEYESTRHNLGFMLIDRIARETGALVKRKECRALVGRAEVEGVVVELVKPQTFMNLSGESVACLIAKRETENAPPTKLLVISDDLALTFGTIRLRARGSAGGHNGLKSIIGSLKTDEFMRLRIGIQPPHPLSDARRFVLEDFPKSERTEVDKILERSADALHTLVRDGIDKAMSLFNGDQ